MTRHTASLLLAVLAVASVCNASTHHWTKPYPARTVGADANGRVPSVPFVGLAEGADVPVTFTEEVSADGATMTRTWMAGDDEKNVLTQTVHLRPVHPELTGDGTGDEPQLGYCEAGSPSYDSCGAYENGNSCNLRFDQVDAPPSGYDCDCDADGWASGPSFDGAPSCVRLLEPPTTCKQPRLCKRIDFDTLPGGGTLAGGSGIDINNQWNGHGVTFSATSLDDNPECGLMTRDISPNDERNVAVIARRVVVEDDEEPASLAEGGDVEMCGGGTIIMEFSSPVDLAILTFHNLSPPQVRSARGQTEPGEPDYLKIRAYAPDEEGAEGDLVLVYESIEHTNGIRNVYPHASNIVRVEMLVGSAIALTYVKTCRGDADSSEIVDLTSYNGLTVRPVSANTYGEFQSAFAPWQTKFYFPFCEIDGPVLATFNEDNLPCGAESVCFELSREPCRAIVEGGEPIGGGGDVEGPPIDDVANVIGTRTLTGDEEGTRPECSYFNAISGEVWSAQPFQYGSIQFKTQPEAASGVVSSVFTFHGVGPPQETSHQIILSFAGLETRKVVTNIKVWPKNGDAPTDYSEYVDIGFDWSLSSHTYTIVWAEDAIEWWVDETLLRRTTTEPIPTVAGRAMAHSWAVSDNEVIAPFREFTGEYTADVEDVHTFCITCFQYMSPGTPADCGGPIDFPDVIFPSALSANTGDDDDDSATEEEECPSSQHGVYKPYIKAKWNDDAGALSVRVSFPYYADGRATVMLTRDPERADSLMCSCNAEDEGLGDELEYYYGPGSTTPLNRISCMSSLHGSNNYFFNGDFPQFEYPTDICDFGGEFEASPKADGECSLNSPMYEKFNFAQPWHSYPTSPCHFNSEIMVPFDALLSGCDPDSLDGEPVFPEHCNFDFDGIDDEEGPTVGRTEDPNAPDECEFPESFRLSGHVYAAITTEKPYDPLTVSGVPPDTGAGSSDFPCDFLPFPVSDFEVSGGCGDVSQRVETTILGQDQPGFCPHNYTLLVCYIGADDCGEAEECRTIHVLDVLSPPVLKYPNGKPAAEITVECGSAEWSEPPLVTSTDNCDANSYVEYTVEFDAPTTDLQEGLDCRSFTRTWVPKDSCAGFVDGTAFSQHVTVTPSTSNGDDSPPPANFARRPARLFSAAGDASSGFVAHLPGSGAMNPVTTSFEQTVTHVEQTEEQKRRRAETQTEIECQCDCPLVNRYTRTKEFEVDISIEAFFLTLFYDDGPIDGPIVSSTIASHPSARLATSRSPAVLDDAGVSASLNFISRDTVRITITGSGLSTVSSFDGSGFEPVDTTSDNAFAFEGNAFGGDRRQSFVVERDDGTTFVIAGQLSLTATPGASLSDAEAPAASPAASSGATVSPLTIGLVSAFVALAAVGAVAAYKRHQSVAAASGRSSSQAELGAMDGTGSLEGTEFGIGGEPSMTEEESIAAAVNANTTVDATNDGRAEPIIDEGDLSAVQEAYAIEERE